MQTPTKPSDAAMKAAERIFYLGVKFENYSPTELAAIIDAELQPQREAMEKVLGLLYCQTSFNEGGCGKCSNCNARKLIREALNPTTPG